MVLFRSVDEEVGENFRFFDWRKKALFYPDNYGPLIKSIPLFKELFDKGEELKLAKPCRAYVHEVIQPIKNFKRSKWGDYYTRHDVVADRVIYIADALKYLKKQGWDVRILTH